MKICKDYNGISFVLIDNVAEHIMKFHPEITFTVIQNVLDDPDSVVKSSWDENTALYYRKTGKYFKTVIVDMQELRIKTALTTDKIKKGDVLWKK